MKKKFGIIICLVILLYSCIKQRETSDSENIEYIENNDVNINSDINSQNNILDNISEFNFIDPLYLKMNYNDYIGKEIRLYGSLSVNKDKYISGKITGFDDDKTEINVLFYGPLSEGITNLYELMINEASVTSHFKGIVGIHNDEVCINILNNVIE